MSHSAEYNLGLAERLIGGKIEAGLLDKDPDGYGEDYYGMRIRMPDGKIKDVFIMSDDEGNDCGSLHVYNENGKREY